MDDKEYTVFDSKTGKSNVDINKTDYIDEQTTRDLLNSYKGFAFVDEPPRSTVDLATANEVASQEEYMKMMEELNGDSQRENVRKR